MRRHRIPRTLRIAALDRPEDIGVLRGRGGASLGRDQGGSAGLLELPVEIHDQPEDQYALARAGDRLVEGDVEFAQLVQWR